MSRGSRHIAAATASLAWVALVSVLTVLAPSLQHTAPAGTPARLADNGVIHMQNVTSILADNGVIHAQNVGSALPPMMA
jgi:hypothetical protein